VHEPALRNYLRNHFPSVEADDVLQQSYLNFLSAHARGRIACTKAYLFAIARNTARRLFRRSQFFSDTPVSELPDSCILEGGDNAAEIANSRQRMELVVEAIARLPSRCRATVTLAGLHGLSNAEVAARLGIAESTVRVQLARGIKKCVEFLRERDEA